MTLTEYETSLVTMAPPLRFVAAGPAYSLRRELFEGEPFTAARDRVAAEAWHATALTKSGQTANFTALTGP
jgi:hypothetical protein